MSAKTGTCVNDQRRAVGTFGGKPVCGTCRPRSKEWLKRRALKIEREEQEAAKKAAQAKTKLESKEQLEALAKEREAKEAEEEGGE